MGEPHQFRKIIKHNDDALIMLPREFVRKSRFKIGQHCIVTLIDERNIHVSYIDPAEEVKDVAKGDPSFGNRPPSNPDTWGDRGGKDKRAGTKP